MLGKMPHHSKLRSLACFAVAIAPLAALAPAPGFAVEALVEAASPVSPLIVTQVPQREIGAVLGTDDRYHVLYELQLTNTLAGSK
jgi:hypothetical protein